LLKEKVLETSATKRCRLETLSAGIERVEFNMFGNVYVFSSLVITSPVQRRFVHLRWDLDATPRILELDESEAPERIEKSVVVFR
jgi:hypothetical protein